MFKKGIMAVLAAVLVLTVVLSGCGGGGKPEEQAGDTPAKKDPVAEKPAEKVKIEFWAMQFEETTNNWWKKWTQEFNKTHDNIEVKVSIVPGDAWAQKLKAAQAAGKAPDIVTMNYGGIAPAVEQGQILSLDEYTDPNVWGDLYENVEEFVTVKGKHYAYPKLVEPSAVLFYRKDFFKEVGLDPEKPPVTWDQMIEYGKKLTKEGRYGLHAAGNAPDFSWSTWGIQMNTGHRPISDDWSKATVMDYAPLLTYFKRMYEENIVPKQPLACYACSNDFGEGKVAMSVSGSWVIGSLRNDYKDILDNVGVAVAPTPDGDYTKPSASLGGWTLVVDGKSKHPKEAAEYITWLLAGNPEIMVDFFRTSKFSKFPTRKSVDESLNQDPEAKNDPWRKLIAEKIVPYSVSEPTYPWDVSFAFGSAIERAIKGESVEESLKKAEAEINDIIKKQQLAGKNLK
jgi:multiple sugar transport system substrate-binding protein